MGTRPIFDLGLIFDFIKPYAHWGKTEYFSKQPNLGFAFIYTNSTYEYCDNHNQKKPKHDTPPI